MSKENPKYNEIIFSKSEEENIINMYTNQNMSTVKIGKKYNCSHKKIARVLESYDIARTGVGRRKYILNENFFDQIDNQDKAYILGFLYADGCNYMPKQTVSMSLQKEDFDILEQIRLCIGNERPLEYLDYSNKHDFGYTYKNQWRLLMFSKHMCETLNNIGMTPCKSLTLGFPDIDSSLHRHFIRGYFDGDGSVALKSPIASLTSTFNFCETVRNILLEQLNIYPNIQEAANHNGITAVLQCRLNESIKFLTWIYDNANLYLKRKYDRFNNYILKVNTHIA